MGFMAIVGLVLVVLLVAAAFADRRARRRGWRLRHGSDMSRDLTQFQRQYIADHPDASGGGL